MIIDNTYFVNGKLAIASNVNNANISGAVNTVSSNITAYIEKYERELLINAIGYSNYSTLKTIVDDNELNDAGNEKWKELVEGKNYTYNSKTVRWNGLRQTFGSIKESLIANYVFFHYLIDDSINYSTLGIQRSVSDKSENYSPSLKLTQVWRDFISKYQYGVELSGAKISTKNGVYTDWQVTSENDDRSLYQFLTDNDDYGDYDFKVYDNRNSLGV